MTAARRGWAVFPCRPADKRPAVDRWEQRACADPERVARYWPGPRHNIGIACGPSRLVVVDLDTAAHGGQLPAEWRAEPGIVGGAEVLAVLAERAGYPWPATYTVRTPAGGKHLYFRAIPDREIRNSASKVGPMIDIRGGGGYVVGAGSSVTGRAYAVIYQAETALLPGWLADLADPPKAVRPVARGEALGPQYGRLRGVVEHLLNVGPGEGQQRNNRLYWAACRVGEMAAAGDVDAAAAEQILYRAAEENGHVANHGERATRATIASGMRTTI